MGTAVPWWACCLPGAKGVAAPLIEHAEPRPSAAKAVGAMAAGRDTMATDQTTVVVNERYECESSHSPVQIESRWASVWRLSRSTDVVRIGMAMAGLGVLAAAVGRGMVTQPLQHLYTFCEF